MTTIAQVRREAVPSTRTPYFPFVMLFGALAVLAVVVRVLNAEEAPAHPLSGAPVEMVGATADLPAPQVGSRAASAAMAPLLPIADGADPLLLGPAAFPPGSSVILSAVLPTSEPTFIGVTLSRLADDGALVDAAPISIRVEPDEDGQVRLATSVDELTHGLGSGIYRVSLTWEDRVIGGADVALGMFQPANVAIFDQPRGVTFAAGEHTGVRRNQLGAVTEEMPFNLSADSGAPAMAYAHFNGRPHVFIVEGVWAGFWMPLSDGVALR